MNLIAKLWNEAHRDLLWELKAALEARLRGEPGHEEAIRDCLARKAELTRSNRYYLARGFDEEAKLACARRHYGWMLERLGPAALRALIDAPQEIWRLEAEGVRYSLWTRVEFWVPREGELSLELFAGEATSLGILSFSVVPGRLFGLDAADVFLLSRIQGRPDVFEQIRLATKAMSEVSPRALLMAALAGVAKSVDVRHVVGVDAGNYIAFLPENRETLERVYDEFFLSLDAEGPVNGFYVVDLLAPPKPVTMQKTGHRVRTRRKRQFKLDVTAAVSKSWPAVLGGRAGGEN